VTDEPEAGAPPPAASPPPAAPPPPDGAPPPAGGTPGVPGWYADPWSSSLLRWWTGDAWTFSTTAAVTDGVPAAPPLQPPPQARATAPTTASSPPPPPPPPPPPTSAPPAPAKRRWEGGRLLVVFLVLGLVAGLLSVRIFRHSSTPRVATTTPSTVERQPSPTTPRLRPPTTPPTTLDPSTKALLSLVVTPDDVAPSLSIGVLPGGDGLTQPTLDLCNGTYPSESLRQARLQDVVVQDQSVVTFSTEAVLYQDAAGAAQALSEVKDVAAACPSTPVVSPVGEPTVTTRFDPAPDGDWPQTDGVTRAAFDVTTTDDTGQTLHSVAVYLQRGRVLLGVYFADADQPTTKVAGQTTIPGIVGVFAGRLAALPPSVVGS